MMYDLLVRVVRGLYFKMCVLQKYHARYPIP